MASRKPRPVDWFIYKTQPFRPLYLGMYFYEPKRATKEARLCLLRNRETARLLAAGNHCEYADFRDYVRIATGGKVIHDRHARNRQSSPPPTLDDLA